MLLTRNRGPLPSTTSGGILKIGEKAPAASSDAAANTNERTEPAPRSTSAVQFGTAQAQRTVSTPGLKRLGKRVADAAPKRARLESENSELSDRLESRKVVERAKGVLQRDFGLDEESAYRAMQKESRQRRKSMREIAEAILLNEDLRRSRLNGSERSSSSDHDESKAS